MIKINLLNAQVSQLTPEVENEMPMGLDPKEVQKQAILRMFLLGVIPLGLYVYEYNSIPTKKNQIQSIETKLNEIKTYNQKSDSAVKEIKKFTEYESKIKKQIDTLEGISKDRLNEIQVLDLIQRKIPEKTWIVGLDFSDSKISLRGQSLTDTDIATFIEELTSSYFLKEVVPGGSTDGSREGQRVRDFNLTAQMETGS